MQKQSGFTLIEMMVVVVIVGILASIALPAYRSYIAKSQVTEAITLTGGLKRVIQENRQRNSCFTSGSTLGAEDQIVGKYGQAMIIQRLVGTSAICGVRYQFNASNVSEQLGGKIIEFQILDNGTIINETTTTVDSKYLPTSIR